MVGFAETDDVLDVLQEAEFSGALSANSNRIVDARIEGVSREFARATNGHWYDSTGGTLIDTTVNTASTVRLDVPASPHRQDAALFQNTADNPHPQYAVSHYGPYCRVPLPHLHVQTVNKLEVRDRGGDVTDWVADADVDEGRGEDYYVQRQGQHSYGKTYLYVDQRTIGPRRNFDGLLTLDYDFGVDYQDDPWDDVKEGIAKKAAAELVDDDEFQTSISDAGQLVNVETKAQRWEREAEDKLGPYT